MSLSIFKINNDSFQMLDFKMADGRKYSFFTKQFIRIWIADVFATFGESSNSIVIMLMAISLTNSASATGIIMMLASLPGIFLSIIGGIFTDTFPRKKMLIIMSAIQSTIIIGLTWLSSIGRIDVFVLGSSIVLLECCSRFYAPAFIASTVDSVDKNEFIRARSFLTTSQSLVSMVGATLIASVVSFFGHSFALAIVALSYILVAILFVKYNDKVGTINKQSAMKPLLSIRDGFAYVRSIPILIKLIFMLSVVNFSLGFYDVGLPFLIEKSLNLPVEYYGYMKTISMFAFIIAGLLIARFHVSNPIKVIVLAVVGMGICVLPIGILHQFNFVAIMWFGAAFLRTICSILLISNISIIPDNTYIGRVTGFVATASSLVLLVARGVSGYVIEKFGSGNVFVGTGLILIITAVFFSTDKHLMGYNRKQST